MLLPFFAAVLAVVPISQASPFASSPLSKRDVSPVGDFTDSNGFQVKYRGCYSVPPRSRTLPATPVQGSNFDSTKNTPQACASACAVSGYNISGVASGSNCNCGFLTNESISSWQTSTECNNPCSGNSSATCGGGAAVNVYSQANLPTPLGVVATYSTPRGLKFNYTGCFRDFGAFTPNVRVLPHKPIFDSSKNTPFTCAQICAADGYSVSGTEYGKECWCGKSIGGPEQVSVVSPDCDIPCSGQGNLTCGAGNHLTIYTQVQGTPAMTVKNYTSADGKRVTYVGCYAEGDTTIEEAFDYPPSANSSRVLKAYRNKNSQATTVEKCVSSCAALNFRVAGIQSGGDCYCDNSLHTTQSPLADSSCSLVCNGDRSEICGGSSPDKQFLSIYNTGVASNIPSLQGGKFDTKATTSASYVTCAIDNINDRVLPFRTAESVGSSMTPTLCIDACAYRGFLTSGVEYGTECWCGPTPTTFNVDVSGCTQPCAGNNSLSCGNSNRLSIYTAVALKPAANAQYNAYTLQGCFVDNVNNRLLKTKTSVDFYNNSPQKCFAACLKLNGAFVYAGLEYGGECFCDSKLPKMLTVSNGCNKPCTGEHSATCGGSNALTLYSNPSQQTSNTASYTVDNRSFTYHYQACFKDAAESNEPRSLPIAVKNPENSLAGCLNAAAVYGYSWAGVEYGGECWAGNYAPTGPQIKESSCSVPCNTGKTNICGGGWALSVYHTGVSTYDLIY